MRNSILVFLILIFPVALLAKDDVVYSMTVAQDGSGDYKSIQDAVNHTKAFPNKRITIVIKNGTYNEKVKVHEWNNLLSLVGESRDGVVIAYDDHFKKIDRGRNSTFHTPTFLVEGDDFRGENLTIKNTAGPVGQAIALAVNADRVVFRNSGFFGFQDTVYLTGENKRAYFQDCYVEGTTDFIFGRATAVFESCRLHAKKNSYITAASTPRSADYGFVFIGCTLTADEGVDKVYLGRPWRPYAKTVFIDTEMGAHLASQGWSNWSGTNSTETTYYAEYNSHGEGGNVEKRADWSRQLTKKQARAYTAKKILGKYEGRYWFVDQDD